MDAAWTVDLRPLLPELILTAGLLVLLVANLLMRRKRGVKTAAWGIVLLLLVAAVTLTSDESVGRYLFGAVVQDGVTVFFRIFFSVAAALCLGLLVLTFKEDGEPHLLVLSSVLGMFVLAGANDLVTLFVALELVSIPSYVLAGYRRSDVRSAEAALKYVIYGALSSGLLIYGFSWLYGLSGTTLLPEMSSRLGWPDGQQTALMIALLLVLAGIGYKIAMVPMHFWCPDVYEGSPTAVTAFLSVVPKAAGFAALYRLLPIFLPLHMKYNNVNAVLLISAVSALTMTFGNLGAIWQSSLKRLLAYSSIAHAGYILMGFAVLATAPDGALHQETTRAILFYLVVYCFMNLGAFFVVDLIERQSGTDAIATYRGLGQVNAPTALLLATFLFSLVGLPPLAGFTGKFLLFAVLIKAKLFTLALIGVANTVVSLYYYVRIIRDMFLEDRSAEQQTLATPLCYGRLAATLSFLTLVPTLVFGLWWGPLAEWIGLRSW
jgi:NADH-quinone oxidoreductase subunit N